MGIRFRRSVKLIPGLRLSAGLRGLSLTAGPRGATVNLGSRGLYGNLGVPGSGLSVRAPLSATPAMRRREAAREHAEAQKHAQCLQNMNLAEDTNAALSDVLDIHLETPSPDSITFVPMVFRERKPELPPPKSAGLLGRLWKAHALRVAARNQADTERYEQECAEWQSRADAHEASQLERKQLIEELRMADLGAMDEFLEERLSYVDWPRETLISFDVTGAGRRLALDVDLPEIEDMPTLAASVSATGRSVRVKELSGTQSRKNYMRHVHGIGVRILGEAFAALPSVELITLSAYSQRPDRATGEAEDQYLFSVKVTRDKWSAISFGNLKDLDPVTCLGSFEIRRKMTAAGTFTRIQPFEK